MTMNSVTPTRPAAPSSPFTPDSGSETENESSLFEVLLADAHHERATAETAAHHPDDEAPSASDPTEIVDSAGAPPRAHHGIESSEHPDDDEHTAPKKEDPADNEALLAALAGLASTPPSSTIPAPVEAPTDPAAEIPTVDTPLLTDLPLPETTIVDETALPDLPITPDIDVTASMSIVDFPAPTVEPDAEPQIVPVHATPTRAPFVNPRPVAEDPSADAEPADDDVSRPESRTAPNPTRDANAAADAARTRTAAAGTATTVAPPTAPTATAVDASASEVTVAAATTAPPPPAEQLVSVLAPLRNTPEGTYSLRLELKPVELGRVEMRVEMRDGVLHASIHADHESSAQLVRASLGELRDLLRAEGVRTGNLTVSDGALGWSGRDGRDTSQAGRDGSPRPTLPDGDNPAPVATPASIPAPTDSDATSLLDVRV